MKDIKCPLCGIEPELVDFINLGLSNVEHAFQVQCTCGLCAASDDYAFFPSAETAWKAWNELVSKFPPIMRLRQGDNVMLFADNGIYTIIDIDLPKGRIYLKDEDEYQSYYYADEVEIWPWELEQKGGAEQ